MNIAIIGMGLSGLAAGWFLLNDPQLEKKITITFIDSKGAGGGASGIAAGLLHPYAGATAKLNRRGVEGYLASCKLLDIVSEKIGKSVSNRDGLLRLAITDRQKSEYKLSSERYEDVIWCDEKEVFQKVSGVTHHPGIFIPKSLVVNCPLYLEGLWRICEERGAKFKQSSINSLDELKDFDQIVLATGAFVNKFLPFNSAPINPVKGQLIELQWPKNLPDLPCALNSQAYLLMDKEKNLCIAGATFEHHFASVLSDIDFASKEILPKAIALIPALKNADIISCKAGIRASTPDHMPIIKKIDDKCWVITGMGSKGLLYHALYAEQLASLISESFVKAN